jgi:hypothetical protein
MDKPLFLPLYAHHFEAFERGEKTVEYRKWCMRWNDRAVRPGRTVTLSRGYSGRRLDAIVIKVERVQASTVTAAKTLYPRAYWLCAMTLQVQR